MRERVAYLGSQLTMVERQADALTTQQAVGDRRLAELEKDMTQLQTQLTRAIETQHLETIANRSFAASVQASVATMKWLIGIALVVAPLLAGTITYIVSHKP